jgi:CBS domain-containing protein
VYDYVAGKQDWLARALPSEGEKADVPVAADIARRDVVTCQLDESIGTVRERVDGSPYGFALVVSKTGVLLGRLRAAALGADPKATAEQAMEAGPSTVRPGVELGALVDRLRKRDFRYGLVTMPDGVLVGVVLRSDAEERLGDKS